MRAGELDRQIVIEKAVETQSATGAPIEVWSEFATVWAGRRDIRAREFFGAQAVQSKVTAVFRIYWRGDLTTDMRVNDGGALFDIAGLAELGRRDGLEIMASALSNLSGA